LKREKPPVLPGGSHRTARSVTVYATAHLVETGCWRLLVVLMGIGGLASLRVELLF
jgi:hypothetical protein